MRKIEIKNRIDGSVIYSGEHETFRDAVVAAIANRKDLSYANLSRATLSYADLSYATLSDADLSGANLSHANLSHANLSGANLSHATLSDATLSDADLSRATLSYADLSYATLSDATLSGATLSHADLSGADLSSATMPGFSDKEPTSLADAAEKTKEWLAGEHWIQGSWIKTPNGAYNGDCLACLHGAAVYVGGAFGKELSEKLTNAGYTINWNDEKGRTLNEVLDALDAVKAAI